ncbi:hypothetical protein GGX14DRAFT_450451 [Mycena pura]|uniref:F-box domain-containing protein n=1 Tax=Mycena pura TaxID=153505 RepID=A0AAD6YFT2_9AGAR|nr:hypothetical protein GGX14DRAFT_450451 [Mycena pura]
MPILPMPREQPSETKQILVFLLSKMPLRQRLSDQDANISELNLIAYPVLTLPPEITAEIFKWCIDTNKRLLPSVAPLLLTRICRDWRDLAFSTPALWDTIIDFDLVVHRQAAAFIETWFSRGGTCPLSLGIVDDESLFLGCLESVILQHTSRLQSLDVMAYSEVLCNLTAIPSFPILRNLELFCLDDDYEDHIQPICINNAPTLRHLSLEYVRPSMVILPWEQLTKMTLSLLPLWECLNALRWATSLQEFCRQGAREEGDQSISEVSPVHNSSLISLAISSDAHGDILPLLTLPCLQRFESGCCSAVNGTCLDADIIPFLSRVSGTLRAFKVGPSPTVPVHWFHPLTQLATLELVHLTSLPDFIHAFNRRALPDFLPKLQSFVIWNCGSDQVDDELLDALGSRCDATDAEHIKLESFSLIWPESDFRPDVRLPLVNVLPLRALAGRGMRIHIGTREQNSFY